MGFRDHRFRCHQKTGNRGCCVLQRSARTTFDRIDDTLSIKITIFAGLGVPAIGEVGFFTQFADNDRTFGTGIFGDLANRCFNRPSHDLDADTLIVVRDRKALERLNGTQESDTATRENAFLCGVGRVACSASSTRSFSPSLRLPSSHRRG